MSLISLPEVKEVEKLVISKFESDAKLLREIPDYLFSLGGKRIRPYLAILLGKVLGLDPIPSSLIQISAGIELIHLATLLHDDIIDKSTKRRNASSPFIKYGTPNTLLAGDFLLVRAFSLCAHLDSYIVERTEVACVELTEGEIEEIPLCERETTVQESIEITRRKTASLFRLATESAGFIALGKPSSELAEFGENLGIAFQLLDDILDVSSTEDILGKQIGTDIREKKPSVLNILWSEETGSRILYEKGELAEEEIKEAVSSQLKSKALATVREMARGYISKAEVSLLKGVPENRAAPLLALGHFVLERIK